MIPVCKPFWGREEEAAMVRVARSGRLIQGPEVERFESMVAKFLGVKYAVACSSGTTALHLALMAAGVGPGDEVLVPAFTFVATANVVLHCGAVPVLGEISLSTFSAELIYSPAWAVIVHPFGVQDNEAHYPHNTIEDAACALGSFKLKGLAATLSFHATKIISTSEGGMVLTNDLFIRDSCRILRDQKHGKMCAYNYRMTEIQGAIGQEQMKKLPDILERRKMIAAKYDFEFNGNINRRPKFRIPPSGGNYQSYVLLLDEGIDRSRIIELLREKEVEALPGTQFLGDMPHLRQFAHGDLPNARIAGERAMRIPIWPGMTDGQIGDVIEAVKGVLG